MPCARHISSSVLAFACVVADAGHASAQSKPAPIKDNSFLIEEAYNQEKGVVQHISTFTRSMSGADWAYAFTQEWPVLGMRHQLSYTVPIVHSVGARAGVGDVAVHYRYQLMGMSGGRFAVAPRVSVVAATGNESRGYGAGGTTIQANLPVSAELGWNFAMHANTGYSRTRSAKDGFGASAPTTSRATGGSLIWLTAPTFNVLVEAVSSSDEIVSGFGTTSRVKTRLLSPGVRAAFNLANDLQIVPGIAYVISEGPKAGAPESFLLYFSLEHPFKR